MYLTDYHLHSKFSFDSKEELDNICNEAILKGIEEIAVTDHLDIYENKPFTYMLDCENWYSELTRLKEKYVGKLKIKLGVEVGTPQYNVEEYKGFYAQYPLDFVIGSIHNMKDGIDFGDNNFKETDFRQLYEDYNNLLIDLADNYDFDVLGHLTYPSRYIEKQLGISVDVRIYKDFYRELFKILIERGKGIELNTSGIARGGDTIMPPLWLIEFYKECGGEIITTGSDAHIAKQVGSCSKIAIEILKSAGFKYITVYENHIPDFIKI